MDFYFYFKVEKLVEFEFDSLWNSCFEANLIYLRVDSVWLIGTMAGSDENNPGVIGPANVRGD